MAYANHNAQKYTSFYSISTLVSAIRKGINYYTARAFTKANASAKKFGRPFTIKR